MEFHYNRGERYTWLIGDSGYPLEPWLLTPLTHYPEGTRQYQYTKKHCKARNIVERFFGVFKSYVEMPLISTCMHLKLLEKL